MAYNLLTFILKSIKFVLEIVFSICKSTFIFSRQHVFPLNKSHIIYLTFIKFALVFSSAVYEAPQFPHPLQCNL